MRTVIHLKNVLFQGALCCIPLPDPDSLTAQPDKVTCDECLVLMGRRPRLLPNRTAEHLIG